MTTNRWLLVIAIVLAVAVASVESLWQSSSLGQQSPQPVSEAEKSVQQYAKELKRWQFDEAGKLQLIVQSPEMLKYQDEQRYWLDAPKAWVLNPKKPEGVWQITADKAFADKRYQQIKLLKNVQVVHQDTVITSENVLLDNQIGKAQTDAPVVLRQGANTTHAVGLEVGFDEQSILLKQQVKSFYAPVTRP